MEYRPNELHYLTASEALTLFRNKKLSPVELMEAVIARCEQVNPQLNAITYSFYDRALDQAKKAETKYLKTGSKLRRLEGLPIAIKDFHPV